MVIITRMYNPRNALGTHNQHIDWIYDGVCINHEIDSDQWQKCHEHGHHHPQIDKTDLHPIA